MLATRHLLCQTSQCLGQCVSHHFMLNQTLHCGTLKLNFSAPSTGSACLRRVFCLDARARGRAPQAGVRTVVLRLFSRSKFREIENAASVGIRAFRLREHISEKTRRSTARATATVDGVPRDRCSLYTAD